MANKEAASNLYFGADLCKQGKNHVEFLNVVDATAELKDPAVLRRAVYRYEKYWLPLASKYPNKCLSAPIDIEWAWHCHLLCPVSYEKDCQTIVGSTVDHMLRSPDEYKNGQKESEGYWYEKYSDERESFHLKFTEELDTKEMEQFKSKLSYDIVAAAKRQMGFVNKVSSPLYRNDKFLENSLQRYKQFLYLETKIPQLKLVPANDIDLMWHTHQSNPLVYKDDMVRITGNMLDHDDTDTDQSEGSVLYNASGETIDTWNEFYKEPLLLNLSSLTVNKEFEACKGQSSRQLDIGMKEMGTCFQRGNEHKNLPDTGMKEMGTCFQRGVEQKNLPDNGMREMGTCFQRGVEHEILPNTGMKEMSTCYKSGVEHKNLPDTGKKEMGTCYARGNEHKNIPDTTMKGMSTCYKSGVEHNNLPDTGKKEMGTCYARGNETKNLPDTGKKEMGTCYARGNEHKNLPDTRIKEMSTCYQRNVKHNTLPDNGLKGMECGYNRGIGYKNLTDAGKKEMGTCYLRGVENSNAIKNQLSTSFNQWSAKALVSTVINNHMGTCCNMHRHKIPFNE